MNQRSLKLDLWLPQEAAEQKQRIVNSIRQYRAMLRKCFGIVAAAQVAGADLEITEDEFRIKPQNEKAKQILAIATGKDGKALGYQLRDQVLQEWCPSWMSFVWDSLRRDLATAWTAKDPEFTKASRGWLILQGARGIGMFNRRAIGFPVATARPKLHESKLTLKWDHEIGPVTFKLGTLDGGRWSVWKALRDGDEGWNLGTVFLGESDGRLFATLTYERPDDLRDVDPDRIATLKFRADDAEVLFTLARPDGDQTFDLVDAQEALAWLARHAKKKIDLEARRAACGAPRKPWGFRSGWREVQETISRATKLRAGGVQHRNHAWTRRVVDRCVSWRCGKLIVEKLPELIGGHSWGWTGFKAALAYKCAAVGIEVVYQESEVLSDI